MSDTGVNSFWQIIPNVVTAGAAAAAVWYARSGLNTWRKQLKGTAEFELARSLLAQTYQLRDSIHILRTPTVSEPQVEKDHADVEEKSILEKSHLAYLRGLEKRWAQVQDSSRELELLLIEAESLWGNESRNKFSQLFGLKHTLHSAINMYFRAHSMPNGLKQSSLDLVEQKILYEMIIDHSSEDGPDDFNKRIKAALKPIEHQLRPYLNRDR